MSQVAPRVNSHLDFQGLGELRGQAQRHEGSALREVAQQFEAMFVQQIMKTMRDASFKGGELIESQAMDTFQSMHDKEISLHIARRGSFGLADMLVRSMERQDQAIPAAEALAARQKSMQQGEGSAALGLGARAAGQDGLPIERRTMVNPLTSTQKALAVPRTGESGFSLKRDLALPGGRLPAGRSAGSAE